MRVCPSCSLQALLSVAYGCKLEVVVNERVDEQVADGGHACDLLAEQLRLVLVSHEDLVQVCRLPIATEYRSVYTVLYYIRV